MLTHKKARETRQFQEAGRLLEEIKTLQGRKFNKEVALKQKEIEIEDLGTQVHQHQLRILDLSETLSKTKKTYGIFVFK